LKHYGKLPPILKKEQISIPGNVKEAIVAVPRDLYTLNIFTWNSPNLNGIVFIPEPRAVEFEELKKVFPNKKIFIMKREALNEQQNFTRYYLRSIK
jgi:hypothetical protein